jgi:hypothetical protein
LLDEHKTQYHNNHQIIETLAASFVTSFLSLLHIFSFISFSIILRDEVTGEWKRLHKKELYALYSSPNIFRVIKSRRLRWAGHVARMGESIATYRALVGKPEGRRPLGRPWR